MKKNQIFTGFSAQNHYVLKMHNHDTVFWLCLVDFSVMQYL